MKLIDFRTAYNYYLEDNKGVCSGSPVRNTYVDSVDENGVSCIKVSGTENFQEYIESAKEDCMIYNILESFDNGTLLNQRIGFYGDVTTMPANIHEAYKMVRDAKDKFNSLPSDVRLQFHNNPDEWLSSISKAVPASEGVKTEGVKTEVVKTEGDKKEGVDNG